MRSPTSTIGGAGGAASAERVAENRAVGSPNDGWPYRPRLRRFLVRYLRTSPRYDGDGGGGDAN